LPQSEQTALWNSRGRSWNDLGPLRGYLSSIYFNHADSLHIHNYLPAYNRCASPIPGKQTLPGPPAYPGSRHAPDSAPPCLPVRARVSGGEKFPCHAAVYRRSESCDTTLLSILSYRMIIQPWHTITDLFCNKT